MINIILFMSLVSLQLVMAGSTLTQIIEQDKGCKVALKKHYSTASGRELKCKSIHILAQRIENTSYRSQDRIINLQKMQRIVKSMQNTKKINWVLQQEIKKNTKNLAGLVWPKNKLVYFDAEIKNKKISFLYAINNKNTIKIDMIEQTLSKNETGNSVQICTKNYICQKISSNNVSLPEGQKFNGFKILSPKGSFSQYFKSIPHKNLVKIAYELNAQLFNTSLPALKSVKVSIVKAPKKTTKNKKSKHNKNINSTYTIDN